MEHLGSLESTQEARVALGYRLGLLLRFFRALQTSCVLHLINRFHVAVRLFSNRSQMTWKCIKNKKVAHEAECVIDVLTTFWRLLWSITESDARHYGIYLFYIITKSLFYFNITRKPAFCPALARKKPFDVIFDLFKMKQFHWLLCVAKNCDWSRKIAPLSNLTRASFLAE